MSELSRQAQSLLTAFHQADGIGEGPTDEQRRALRHELRHLMGASAFAATMTVASKAAATHGLAAAPAPVGLASAAVAESATAAAGGATVAATVGAGATSAVMTTAAVGTHSLVGLLVSLLIGASAGGVVVGTSALVAREPSSPEPTAIAARATRDTGATEHTGLPHAPGVNPTEHPMVQVTPSPTAAPPSVSPPGASLPTTERDLPPPLRASPGSALQAPVNQPVQVEPFATTQADTSRATLGEEVSLLRTAQEHIKAGRATGALELLDEHRRRFPQGDLRIEGRAARVVALCQLGRMAEGQREWSDFARDYPDSPLLSRLATACKNR